MLGHVERLETQVVGVAGDRLQVRRVGARERGVVTEAEFHTSSFSHTKTRERTRDRKVSSASPPSGRAGRARPARRSGTGSTGSRSPRRHSSSSPTGSACRSGRRPSRGRRWRRARRTSDSSPRSRTASDQVSSSGRISLSSTRAMRMCGSHRGSGTRRERAGRRATTSSPDRTNARAAITSTSFRAEVQMSFVISPFATFCAATTKKRRATPRSNDSLPHSTRKTDWPTSTESTTTSPPWEHARSTGLATSTEPTVRLRSWGCRSLQTGFQRMTRSAGASTSRNSAATSTAALPFRHALLPNVRQVGGLSCC